MIEENEVFEVTRVEHHFLATCPCRECKEERMRRQKQVAMKPDVARAFYGPSISTRPKAGSVAREVTKAG